MSGLKILNAVLCEDIRTEQNGKQILIGVYQRDIRFSGFPARFAASIWLQLADLDEGPNSLPFRVTLDGSVAVEGGVDITVAAEQTTRVTLPLGAFPVEVRAPGILKFDIKDPHKGRWRNAIEIPVLLQT